MILALPYTGPMESAQPALPEYMRLRYTIALICGSGTVYVFFTLAALSAFLQYQRGAAQDPFASDPLYLLMVGLGYFFVFGGLLWALLRFVCLQRFDDLNLKPGSLGRDFIFGLGICVASIFLMNIVGWLVYILLPEANTTAGSEMTMAMVDNPLFLVVSLGPYNWLAAAFVEEFNRCFFMSRLMAIYPGPQTRVIALGASSLLFGIYHIYYGVAGAIEITVVGLLLGSAYLATGRIAALIFAHGLYGTYAVLYSVWYYSTYGEW